MNLRFCFRRFRTSWLIVGISRVLTDLNLRYVETSKGTDLRLAVNRKQASSWKLGDHFYALTRTFVGFLFALLATKMRRQNKRLGELVDELQQAMHRLGGPRCSRRTGRELFHAGTGQIL